MEVLRHVAVFDSHLPPGLAFIRCLGALGVPVTVFSHRRFPAGRFSRFTSSFRRCPNPSATDEFTVWLTDELRSGRIDLVAPTSDAISFCLAEAHARVPDRPPPPGPSREAIQSVLFKNRFSEAMQRVGFPAPAAATPVTVEGYRAFAAQVGFPVVLKPRSHVGVGGNRGEVVFDMAALEQAAVPLAIPPGNQLALEQDADLQWPLIQRYIRSETTEIVSVSGCLAPDGSVLAIGHSRKTEMWPPQVGVGTEFEWLSPQPFTEQALDAVREVIGSGLFEFEVCHDRATGQSWPIDLNARGYGQMSLDVANGNNLPVLWYRSVSDLPLDQHLPRPPNRSVRAWRLAVPFYVGRLVAVVVGPDRRDALRSLVRAVRLSTTGAVAQRNDPVPALVYSSSFLRHPGGLIRPFLDHARQLRSCRRRPTR